MILLSAVACAQAAELRPDQQAALDKILSTLDPNMREVVRPQLETTIRSLTPEQVAMFSQSVAGGASNDTAQSTSKPEEPEPKPSPEDLAFNRAQYEPALRKHWDAKKAFDTFVDLELAKCPQGGKYAVYREAERYEIMELSPQWQRAPDNRDAEASIVGASYAPQDGRYQFDFSKVRMTFNKDVVGNAVTKACADWTKEATAFKAKASPLMNAGQSQAALDLQGAVSRKVGEIQQTLQQVLDAEGPAGNYNTAMMQALQKPKRVK
jgi:hypothetical protein